MANKLPTPKAARSAAGLSALELAAKAECGLMTVYRSERTGSYPIRHHTRKRYLAALGLTETQAQKPVKATA